MFTKQSSSSKPTWWVGGDDPVVLNREKPVAFSFTPGFTPDSLSENTDRSPSRLSNYSVLSETSDQQTATSARYSDAARPSDFSALSAMSSEQGATNYRDSPAAQPKDFMTMVNQQGGPDYTYNAPSVRDSAVARPSHFSPATDYADSPDSNYGHRRVFVVPVQGSETPLTLANAVPSTPDIYRKLSKAHTDDVHNVALRMYKVLKENGLGAQAQQAFEQSRDSKYPAGASAPGSPLDGEEDGEGLMGMDYLLKDGIVNYLRDVAKLTPPLPQQVVRFYDVSYYTQTQAPVSGFETFGAKLFNCFFGLFATPFRKKEKPQHLDILKDITGYIMPGSMTLLLGPPGSGKSSLLKVLAGRAQTNKLTRLEGTVLFNNRVASEILLTRLIAYVDGQLNQHLPFLTVRETLEFAGDCSQKLKPETFTPQMRRFFAHALVEGQDPYLEYILHVLGLKDIEHHLVGSGPTGITENDRNRLTTAEIAMGTYSVMLYDQPCFGQDSLATYDLVSLLRAIGRFQQCSAVMSLVQLSPEVFDLFDRVILLGEGEILYQGPRQDVLHYFDRLGFTKPVHMDAGDFLMEIAAGEGSQYLRPGNKAPSLAELAITYKLSDAFKDVMRIVHNEDVVHALWVESEPNLGLSVKKKRKTKKTIFIDNHDNPHRYPRTPSLSSSLDGSPGSGGVEVIVSKLSSSTGRSPNGRKLRGIESSGTVAVGDLVTGICLANEDMLYLNVSQSKKDQRSRASGVASLLANARGHVRLQVERIRDPEALEQEEAQAEQFSQEYIQTWRQSTTTLIKRQIRVHRRVWLMSTLRLFQVLVMGLFGGALFYEVGGKYLSLKMNATRSVGFVPTGNLMLVAIVQLPLFMAQRPTFYKQRKQRFFRVSSYIVSQSIVAIPQALLEALIYTATLYFLVGLYIGDYGASFLQVALLLFVVSYFSTIMVFTLSGLTAVLEQANSLAGLIVSLCLLFSGFIIFPLDMPSYWRFFGVLTPLRWANVAFCASQFERLYPELCNLHMDIFWCKNYANQTVGFAFLDHYQLKAGEHSYWLGIAVIVAWCIIMHVLAYMVYKTIHHISVTPSLPSQTEPENQHSMMKTPQSSMVTDARHDTPSGISWAGFVVQGDADLWDQFSNFENSSGYSGVRTPKSKLWPKKMEYDLEAISIVKDDQSEESYLSWRSSSLPVKAANLSFYNLGLLVQDPKSPTMRLQLDKVSGYAKPGKMLALMGGNKSDTTTLLQVLANRGPRNGHVLGEILVNGFKINAATYFRVQGFVERLDAHQPFLTIRESLMFSAALRLPREVLSEDRSLHIELILDLLELTEMADQLVGSLRDATGRTFELAKKITIAVELAANPSILFLDEPTSGLDGLGARNIIHAIQIIAGSGRTIIATMDHPSSRMLSAFNSVMLLSTAGQQVYFGPVGPSCGYMLEYFGSIPKVPKYDLKKNPVTHVLDILGCGITTRDPLYDFAEVYRQSSLASLNNEELNLLRKQSKRNALKLVSSGYAASFSTQAIMVFKRTQKFLWRNVGYTFGRIVSAIAVGLILGLVFLQIPYNDTLNLTSRSLFIYLQVLLIGVVTANNVVPQLGTDRLAYFRERRARMYSPIFYPISWAIAEIPYIFLGSLFFVAIGNGLAGIGTDSVSNFLRYLLSLFVFVVAMAYFAMMITIATPMPMLASFIVSIILSLWITAAGVVVTFPIFNRYLVWTFWSDPFQYVINTLTSVSFYCDVNSPQCSKCIIPNVQPCPLCGCTQLKDLGYEFSWTALTANRAVDYSRIPLDFGVLTTTGALFAVLAFLAFVTFKHNKP